MYSGYVSLEEYMAAGYTTITAAAANILKDASRNVDSLTFNRINTIGFDNLTGFQKDIIIEVVCEMADYLFNNSDTLNAAVSSYSINGVSVTNDGGKFSETISGVTIPKSLKSKLNQTGLTCLLARR